MGVLSRAIGGAAKGAVTHFKQLGEERRRERLQKDSREYDQIEWERRNKSNRSYTEGQRDIQNERTEGLYNERLKETRENSEEITKGKREHTAKLLEEKHTYDAGVANSWWGSGSQKNFNAELKLLADRAYGDKYQETEDEVHKNSQEWRDGRTKYINKVKNELVDGGYKTIFDWEQRDEKPETGTPPPTPTSQTTVKPKTENMSSEREDILIQGAVTKIRKLISEQDYKVTDGDRRWFFEKFKIPLEDAFKK
jgi:hypothetical protein